jgi:hypothetical protein
LLQSYRDLTEITNCFSIENFIDQAHGPWTSSQRRGVPVHRGPTARDDSTLTKGTRASGSSHIFLPRRLLEEEEAMRILTMLTLGGGATRFGPATMMSGIGGWFFDDAAIRMRRRRTWVPNECCGGRGCSWARFIGRGR